MIFCLKLPVDKAIAMGLIKMMKTQTGLAQQLASTNSIPIVGVPISEGKMES